MHLVEAESPVTGVVWQVRTTVGAAVAAGDVLLVVESMKMEIPVESPVAGTVAELLVTEGDAVGEDAVVARIDPA
ncbi:MAG: acetyl-CoA carboxylase biotin carboxyl carrier protein subunit [Acidimicrobiales bacterium]|nr:acetyl-CoA carboxylase biotin carboxyl carrier protein subunit [Acidimicrobiales bacterium]